MPLDPGFQDTPAGAWTTDRGAAVMPAATGTIEPGALVFDKTALCAGARARQTITMPSRAASEAFALRVAASGNCRFSSTGQSNDCTATPTSVVMNGAAIVTYSSSTSGATSPRATCLGERAYGGIIDVAVQPAHRASCSYPAVDLAVDHVGIEPLASCPMPGTLPDGNFDAATSNWTLSQPGTPTPNPEPVAEFQTGAGTNGSRAAHLRTNDICQRATIQGLISPPLASIPNLALQMTYRGTVGESMTLQFNGTTIATIAGSAALAATARACLPETSKGMTHTALLGLVQPGGSISCAPPRVREFVIDDLQFVSDPTCPAAAWIADGGFERTDPATMWELPVSTNTAQGGIASAGIDTTAANAHGGARSIKLSTNGGCSHANVSFPISVPMATATAGPALTFFYKASPALSSARVTVGTSNSAPPLTLGDARSYTPFQVCLDPTLGGQTVGFYAFMVSAATDCIPTFTAESIWIDDVVVTTSPTCPTN